MASELYPYPAELDSDDEGSIEYDWENDSQIDDDNLSFDMDRLQIRGGSAVPGTSLPGTPPPRAARPPNNITAHLCVVSRLSCCAPFVSQIFARSANLGLDTVGMVNPTLPAG